MRKTGIRILLIAATFVIALATPASAAQKKGGGGGGGGAPHGGGGAPHVGGGGGAPHIGGGGGAPHVGGGGGPHVGGGGGGHYNAGGVHRVGGGAGYTAVHRFSARPGVSHPSTRAFTRVNPSRAVTRTVTHAPVTTGGKVTANAKLHANVGANTVRKSLTSRSFTHSLRNTKAFHDPHTRASITAHAAMAGSRHGRGGNGWWRHGNGGYGWVGPLFWPFAYYDMYDYALWGDDYDDSFWGYGYDDLYAGLFSPYSYDDLTGYLPQSTVASPAAAGQAAPASATPGQLTTMCGNDNRDIAGLGIDQFQQAIQPDAAQRAALDDLAAASLKAAQDIKAACPADIALTAPSRLAAMQTRIEAMIAAIAAIQPPLEKFYGLLSDEQKAKITALGEDQRKAQATKTGGALATTCGAAQSPATGWPTAEIEQTVHPTDAQRASLTALEAATAKAADMLKTSCPAGNPLTPPARLAAAGQRLDTMLQAVKTVRSALDDFYGSLNDEQKAKFDAIGPQLTSEPNQPTATQTPAHRRRHRARHSFRRFFRYF